MRFAPLSFSLFSGFGYAISTLVLEAAQNLSGRAGQSTLDDQKIYAAVDSMLYAI